MKPCDISLHQLDWVLRILLRKRKKENSIIFWCKDASGFQLFRHQPKELVKNKLFHSTNQQHLKIFLFWESFKKIKNLKLCISCVHHSGLVFLLHLKLNYFISFLVVDEDAVGDKERETHTSVVCGWIFWLNILCVCLSGFFSLPKKNTKCILMCFMFIFKINLVMMIWSKENLDEIPVYFFSQQPVEHNAVLIIIINVT